MTIYLGSRYEDSLVDFVAFNNTYDAAPVVFYQFTDIGKIDYTTYVWKDGDRLDQLAYRFYNYAEKWWVIAEYNPEVKDPNNITPGTVLRIPYV